MDNELVLTSSGLLAFLAEVEELKGCTISVAPYESGLSVQIGDNEYKLESQPGSEVVIDDEIVDEVQDINEAGFNDIEGLEVIEDEAIEGGIIKELIKTLAVGGLVRLTKNAIAKS